MGDCAMRTAPKLFLDLYVIWASAPTGTPTSLHFHPDVSHDMISRTKA